VGAVSEDTASESEGTASRPSPSAIDEIKERLRQLSQPLVDNLDARLARQVDAYLEAHLAERVEALVAARLAVIERALADLDRTLRELTDEPPRP
jgi:hypothetical protein